MSDLHAPNPLTSLFTTEIYRAELAGPDTDFLLKHLEFACRKMAVEHSQGLAWSEKANYVGYTSYGTIKDLPEYAPVFADLGKILDAHALNYATLLDMDLKGKTLVLQEAWINVLAQNGGHGSHFHAQSTLSGTVYISVPPGANGIQFEDPRSAMMMHAPSRHPTTRLDRQAIVPITLERGTLLLWESWLRHEVGPNRSSQPRISISFNYDLA